MTDRGLPIADGATACPFVAFVDDRDERAAVPDHRHRCYAETRPAPRAIAHQEAYCLSSAFPVCPTFQDWARREAARARDGHADTGRVPAGAAVEAARPHDDDEQDDGPAAGSGRAAAGAGLAGAAGAAGAAGDAATGTGEPTAAGAAHPGDDDDDSDQSHGASAADADPDARNDDVSIRRNPPRDWAAPPPWLASAEASRRDADAPPFLGRRASEPGQGLVGSAADLLAGGQPVPTRPSAPDEIWSASAAAAGGGGPASAASGARSSDDGPGASNAVDGDDDRDDPAPRRAVRRSRAYSQHLGGTDGPDWERPRRYEAYPTIKTRVGMPQVPRIVLLAGAVGALALLLFFLPGIVGFGSGPGSPNGTPGASSGTQPSASLAPTQPPAPTPVLYTIKQGDVLSKVATAHGVTLEELLAANPSIKNPNKITPGQQITIPPPTDAPPGQVGGSPSASTAP